MASLLHAVVYHPRSERVDPFAHKRYTNPEVERFRSVFIEAEVIEEKDGQVMLRPLVKIDDVPESFVVHRDCLALVRNTNEIRQRDIHGCPDSILNQWKVRDGNGKPAELY